MFLQRLKKGYLYKCDFCYNFYQYYCFKKSNLVFCSRFCADDARKKNQILFEQMKNNSLMNYNVEHPMKSSEIYQRVVDTNVIKYGTKCTIHNPKIHEKMLESNILKYGVQHPLQNEDVKKSFFDSFFDKHGVTNPYQMPHNIKKCRLPETRKKISKPGSFEKQYQTKQKNGTLVKSLIEDKLFIFLCNSFQKVERQILISGHRWLIDFYIVDNNTYIQLDGKYWHGLDRPVEVIQQFKSPRDVNIFKKILTDNKQNIEFTQSSKKLLRITDIDVKKLLKNGQNFDDVISLSYYRNFII